jgi:hypothetical protein
MARIPLGPHPVPVPELKYRISARYTDSTIIVHQAYPTEIGLPAVREGRFPAAWQRHRMTWIKPSFLWMMYRCGWGTKEGQEAVLAVEITREGFEWALGHACLSHYERALHSDRAAWKQQMKRAPARVQWDPERDVRLRPLRHRSLQLGLAGEAAHRYADEWTVSITDITTLAHEIHRHVQDGNLEVAQRLLPRELPYPVPDGLLDHLRA